MRTLKPTLALASLVGFFTAASCTLITDVDRTKIPTDTGPAAGAPGTGGMSGGGGTTGGTSGSSGEGGQNPTGGTGGGAGETSGGTGGNTGATGGTGGTGGGTGGTGGTGAVTAVCDQAEGTITLAPLTFLSDGDTFTLSDGVNAKVVFEFDLTGGVASGHKAIAFDGSEDQFGLASLIAQAINGEGTDLFITAKFREAGGSGGDGAAGAAGATNAAGGAPGAAGGAPGTSGGGGEAGTPAVNPATDTAHVDLVNDLSGALGNVRITDTVGNPNFQTTGMAGGKAVACGSPASCSGDAECASGNCSDNLCTE
jgi:hypothetical protein